MDYDNLSELSIRELWVLFDQHEDVDQGEIGLVLAEKLSKEGNPAEAIAVAERVVALGERLGNNHFLASGYFRIGWSNYALSRFDESYAAYKTCVNYFLVDGMEYAAAASIGNAIDGLLEMDKFEDALSFSLEGLNLARRYEETRQIGYLGRQYIRACRALDEIQEIVNIAPEIIDAWRQIGDAEEVVRVRELYADALFDVGDYETSLDTWRENEKVARVLEMRSFEANAILKQAHLHLLLGEPRVSVAESERGLELCLNRKLLWLAAKGHWLLAESGVFSRAESLQHIAEGLAIVRTTTGADGILYRDLLISKLGLSKYYAEFEEEFYSAAEALLKWSGTLPQRNPTMLYTQARVFERYLDEKRYDEATALYHPLKEALSKTDPDDIAVITRILFGTSEILLLLHQEEYQEVVNQGFVFLDEFAEIRTERFQFPVAYEAIGDALDALGDARAYEMWNNALILFGYMNLELGAESVAAKLLDTVKVPGQLL